MIIQLYHPNDLPPVRQAKRRIVLVAGCMAIAFIMVLLHLAHMSIVAQSVERKPARLNASAPAYLPERANIVDRTGKLLVANIVTYSVYADPKHILDAPAALRQLKTVLPNLETAKLLKPLSDKRRRFLWIKRNLTPSLYQRINSLGIPGIEFKREERRLYPGGNLAAHVLGYTDVDAQGLGGIEAGMNTRLQNDKTPLALSIDTRIQHILADELEKSRAYFNGIGALGMILDIKTGEILAMVSLPDFDPNDAGKADSNARFNRATLGVYEMGSTIKIFTTAMALDSGVTDMKGQFDATNPIRVGRFTIDDYKGKHRWLSVPEIFMFSSNIGSVKMAEAVGIEGHRAFISKIGLTRPMRLELAENGSPIVPRVWHAVTSMTISFGHSISVNAVQLCGATAGILNGGLFYPPTLLKDGNRHKTPIRLVSEQTSLDMRKLMRLTVTHGTGSKSEVTGYFPGGKTGTAEKSSASGYKKKALLSSFIAAYPMYDPQYLIFAMVDEPQGRRETGGYATGGWVSAPVVARVIERISPLLGQLPKATDDPIILRALAIDPEDPTNANLAKYH